MQLQKLLEEEHNKKNKNSANECIISHGDSPNSFYVQLKKRSAELDLIVKTLQSSKEKLEKLTNPAEKLNGVCYAPEDDCYYRCCINSVLPRTKVTKFSSSIMAIQLSPNRFTRCPKSYFK